MAVNGFTNYLEAKLLDHVFSDPAYSPPSTLYVALSSTVPTEGGTNFTEPGAGYTRLATTSTDWAPAALGDPTTKTNVVVFQFPLSTGSWGTLQYFGIFDAAVAGNLLIADALTVPQTVAANSIVIFNTGELVIALGDCADC